MAASKLHIGKLIKQKFDESGITKVAFAQKLNCGRNNIYLIFDKNSINTQLLYQISTILHFDFFSAYSAELNKETAPKLDT
jgi:plasmid maintenance system antidote protein VapI